MNALTRFTASATVGLSLLATPLAAFDIDSMNSAERDAFGQAVRSYLLENPEVIMEAVAVLEQRQAAAEAARDDALVETYLAELQNDGYSWVGGNPEGDITVVEFMDYRCGYCRRAVPEIAKLLEKDGNIRLVVKEFPILGEASMTASRFAIATKNIAGDAAYKAVHDALLAFSGEPTDVALRRLAKGLDLDGDAILAGMNAPEVTEAITRTRALAQQLSISGTPSFVVDTELLRGYLPADAMLDMVKEIRDARG
ncbi:Protein-disulfide isomerase [Tritonibacter multivorans]|uniref:Protein-disulfide isomerase n=1 Tax=Tritonibacter multivorans TaxID=928856 RepID=A0A0N7M0I8_9RHOB|nr:DsbA family protein [Tritonibacter multivorans]MDA7420872.1 DsbA family protein [Tritonibacter multivorans]CUH80585.1 Protein-disulfide isomerase [Tritonibacter multivorans]SFC83878.1 Protein-disulfide isomerase [Tritonibacter multivorans]